MAIAHKQYFFKQKDKQLHIICSFAICMFSLPLAVAAGVGKELYDEYQHYLGDHPHGWCWGDMLGNAIGITLAMLIKLLFF